MKSQLTGKAKDQMQITLQHRSVKTPEAEVIAHATLGAVVGGIVAGPVGALAGAAAGVVTEKGPSRPGLQKKQSSRPNREASRQREEA